MPFRERAPDLNVPGPRSVSAQLGLDSKNKYFPGWPNRYVGYKEALLVTIVVLGNLHAFFEVIERNGSTVGLAQTHVTLEFDVHTLILPLPSQNKTTASNARSHAFLELVHTLIGHPDRLPNQAIELQLGRRCGYRTAWAVTKKTSQGIS